MGAVDTDANWDVADDAVHQFGAAIQLALRLDKVGDLAGGLDMAAVGQGAARNSLVRPSG